MLPTCQWVNGAVSSVRALELVILLRICAQAIDC